MRSNRTAIIIILSILFLFFLQALSDFFQSIYAFGLLVTAFTIQLAAALLLFTPLILVFVRKMPRPEWMLGIAYVAILARLLEPLLDPGGRLVASGISVGAFMLLFPILLASNSARLPVEALDEWPATWGLCIAVMLSILLRAAGSSLDISEYGFTQIIAWALAAVAGWLMWRLISSERGRAPKASDVTATPEPSDVKEVATSHEERRQQSLLSLERRAAVQPEKSPVPALEQGKADGSTARVLGPCLGLATVIVIIYFALMSPSVMARWTDEPSLFSMVARVVSLAVFSLVFGWFRPCRTSRTSVAVGGCVFAIALILTVLSHQIVFPSDPLSYPVGAPWRGFFLAGYAPIMAIWAFAVFLLFGGYLRQLLSEAPSLRQLGFGFALGGLFILLMVLMQVLTTVYDYAGPIGPVFRDRSWLVYLVAALALVLPILLVRSDIFKRSSPPEHPRFVLVAIPGLAVLAVAAMLLTSPRRYATPSPQGLRVMTYNIQQGFDKVGNTALPQQLEAIRKVDPDVLGIEESDTARVANGNVDAVRYFADNLGMYSYYGPSTTVGTFGIALLSKYPIHAPETFFMYSTGEQTAAVWAIIKAQGKTYNVFVTHLGNDGPMIQLKNVLSRVDGGSNVILMGDFNFDPSTPQYALARQTLEDVWLVRWPHGHEIYPTGSEGRIDLMFVSPGTQITDAEYVSDGSSDHPYLYAVIKP